MCVGLNFSLLRNRMIKWYLSKSIQISSTFQTYNTAVRAGFFRFYCQPKMLKIAALRRICFTRASLVVALMYRYLCTFNCLLLDLKYGIAVIERLATKIQCFTTPQHGHQNVHVWQLTLQLGKLNFFEFPKSLHSNCTQKLVPGIARESVYSFYVQLFEICQRFSPCLSQGWL